MLLGEIRVARRGPGRPRTTPESLSGDKAYSSRANRELLCARGITAVIPERTDQIANRQRKGSAGGRPVSYDAEQYKNRNVLELLLQPDEALARPGQPLRQARHHYRGGVVLIAIVNWLKP